MAERNRSPGGQAGALGVCACTVAARAHCNTPVDPETHALTPASGRAHDEGAAPPGVARFDQAGRLGAASAAMALFSHPQFMADRAGSLRGAGPSPGLGRPVRSVTLATKGVTVSRLRLGDQP